MRNNRVDKFVKDPKKALFVLALPMLIAMMVQTLYNVVDTAFVGRLGAESIAALTFSFPLFMLLIACTSGIGAGMGSMISRFMGARNKKQAENTAMHGLLLAALLSVTIISLMLPNLGTIFSVFGATSAVNELAVGYMSIILVASLLMLPAFAMNAIFSSQGDTKTPMLVQVTALVANMILDPIFIYMFGFGVQGAAIATTIALAASLALYAFLLRKRSMLHISSKSFRFDAKILKEIALIGAPATFMMLLMSVSVIFLNYFMSSFGTDYVAASGLVWRLESLAYMPAVSISLATLTLVGMFFGAKRYDLLAGIVSYSVKIAIIFTSAVGVLLFSAPSLFMRIFTADTALISLASAYMRIEVFTFPLFAIVMIVSRAMQGMGTGIPGFIFTLVRIAVVTLPMAYLFVFVMGFSYLWVAVAWVSGFVVADIIALVWLKIELKTCRLCLA